jgi:hypothetical protein
MVAFPGEVLTTSIRASMEEGSMLTLLVFAAPEEQAVRTMNTAPSAKE